MKLTVDKVMTTAVVTIRDDASIDDAFSLMLRHHISGLPVVDGRNVLVGVISEMDLLRVLDAPDTQHDLVRDHASSPVVAVAPTDSLPSVVELFHEKRFRRLPVVDGQQRLIGVVSRRDLIRFIRDVRVRVALELRRNEQSSLAGST